MPPERREPVGLSREELLDLRRHLVNHAIWAARNFDTGCSLCNPKEDRDQYRGVYYQCAALLYWLHLREHDNFAVADHSPLSDQIMQMYDDTDYGSVQAVHPDLVPYDDLPDIEKAKDDMDLFIQAEAVKLWERIHEDFKLMQEFDGFTMDTTSHLCVCGGDYDGADCDSIEYVMVFDGAYHVYCRKCGQHCYDMTALTRK